MEDDLQWNRQVPDPGMNLLCLVEAIFEKK
jgi:hypothetical protein